MGNALIGVVVPETIPPGTIEIWAGTIANIPSGWVICDGNNGTPNLLSRFVRGVATNSTDPGATGGLDDVTITSSQIASHNHTAVAYTHQHTFSGNTSAGSGGIRKTDSGDTGSSDDKNSSNTIPPSQNLIATGSNGPHENKPPFFQIAYIMKL